MIITRLIREGRARKGVTWTKASQEMRLGSTYLKDLMGGKKITDPTVKRLMMVAAYFEIPLPELWKAVETDYGVSKTMSTDWREWQKLVESQDPTVAAAGFRRLEGFFRKRARPAKVKRAKP